MAKPDMKGTVTSLSSVFPAAEAEKAAKRVEDKIAEKRNEMEQLKHFIAENSSLINLVQKLPDELHHDIMVPFGKAAFFPGRLVHTNELMVLLGEGYYAERSAKQTVEILRRREKSLEAQVNSFKAVMEDLKLEASFFSTTASEVAEGLVEISEEYEDDNPVEELPESGQLEKDSPSILRTDNNKGSPVDDEFSRMMARLDELEQEELNAEDDAENDEDQVDNAIKTENLLGEKYIDNIPVFGELPDKFGHKVTDQPNCTGLTVDPNVKDISNSSLMASNFKTVPSSGSNLNNPGGRLVHLERRVRFEEQSPKDEAFLETSKSRFDSSKAFTGSIVEHVHNLQTQSAEPSGSRSTKPVSRFKMQRKFFWHELVKQALVRFCYRSPRTTMECNAEAADYLFICAEATEQKASGKDLRDMTSSRDILAWR